MKRYPFFLDRFHSGAEMRIGDFTCELNMPPALVSRFRDGVESAQPLPPYRRRAAFRVDDYPKAPKSWMRSGEGVTSYIVPVVAEHGLWLDFNGNWSHTHDVAIVVSVQGVNAVTCMKAEPLRLEQYRERCPRHGLKFVGNRRCEHPECGYEWPAQNYLCTTGAGRRLLWIDGFRQPDGAVRQYVFTEKECRSVAKAILGEERVHALGIAFFLSRKPKPQPVVRKHPLREHHLIEEIECQETDLDLDLDDADSLDLDGADWQDLDGGPEEVGFCSEPSGNLEDFAFDGDYEDGDEEVFEPLSREADSQPIEPKKKFEVAAGAKIDQEVSPDPQSLDYWQDEPAGIIVVNYTDEGTCLEVISAGATLASREGPLGRLNIPLGHGGSD
jgi:hypothetical protein